MLLGLIIKNLAIAKDIELSFDNNLIIITGETGAGKTIIMNAIAYACGGNASTNIIRTGEESATVETSFFIGENQKIKSLLEEYSIYEGEDVLVISRTISKTRSKVIVNGHLISLKQLAEIGKNLIDMHGQHEIQSLLDKSTHLTYLDKFSGEKISKLRETVISDIAEYKKLDQKIKELIDQDNKFRQERDFINYEITELEKANLKEGEEEELEAEYKLLSNAKELINTLESVQESLSSGDFSVSKMLNSVILLLQKVSDYSTDIKGFKERLESTLIDIKETSRDIANFYSSIVVDPDRLSYLEGRLDEISKLKLKYKKSVKELIAYLSELKNSVKSFNEVSEEIEELKKRKEILVEKLKAEVVELSKLRQEAAKEFEKQVENELKDLAMENAKFMVKLNQIEDPEGLTINEKSYKLFSDGIDVCEFLISPNPPHDFKPLVSIASGGELSRVMLAIKYVIAKVDDIPVLAFDEVDAGIGGKTGEKVAEKLFEISKYRQVICITHLPQIASLPSEHFVVEKVVRGDETVLTVKKLNEFERINEIARMISGTNITDTTIKQAKELIGRWKSENSCN
ncbi:DNA repair protein RecN [Caldisericum exile]|uniref:DNA repair protein RecN n=1 Tax=Caldisericum exile (strain DSM 21853 / NBRC 104410 / AZM16c01) TaxID=511051 RepID=A0A7U6JGV4_CALEA|nr:DNA repair protein RecN [Caldisericum exile]BAL80917.1 DNA repair protein RecN [Caldisericum exile AZM16c01]